MARLVLIEDDETVANIYRNKLVLDGHEVELARDGEDGLALIRSYRPAIVILDLMLPKLSGIEVMKQVRATPGLEQLPIVVFSNTYLTNMVQEAWKAGATKCLSKSNCSPKQVLEIIRNLAAGTDSKPAAPNQSRVRPQVTAPATPAAHGEEERRLLKQIPADLAALRSGVAALFKAEAGIARDEKVGSVARMVHSLTSNSSAAGLRLLAQVAEPLEALVTELKVKPEGINSSSLRTVASAVDFLSVLANQPLPTLAQELPHSTILVVDDEPISRRAVAVSLEKARLKSVNVESPQVALALLQENAFDLVFLDVDMPGMNGFELCSELRKMPTHAQTPVVFVTSMADFQSRAQSSISGGNDFIAKPFLFVELAVKAIMHMVRAQIERGPRRPTPTPAPAVATA